MPAELRSTPVPRERLLDLLRRMQYVPALVVGDVILDEYILGSATRLSREAPIPVLEFVDDSYSIGGAGNPAVNMARLMAQPTLIGVIGTDEEGDLFRSVLLMHGVSPTDLVRDESRPTTRKTRIMAQMGLRFPQQVARIDRLSRAPISPTVEAQVIAAIQSARPDDRPVLLSDYRGGLLTPAVVRAVIDAPGGGLVTADSQGDFDKYRGAGVIKCNADEARDYLRRSLDSDETFMDAARDLLTALDLDGMVITRGAEGATVAWREGVTHIPAPRVTDVFDTVGAGDTTIAVISLALHAGATLVEAVTLANIASGIVVRRIGNYAPTQDEMREAVAQYG